MSEYNLQPGIYEYGYQIGHRALFSLRPGETMRAGSDRSEEGATMTAPSATTGVPPLEAGQRLTREEFEARYRKRFVDPVFRPLGRELDAIIAAAWDAYSQSRKAPLTRKAGAGFAGAEL